MQEPPVELHNLGGGVARERFTCGSIMSQTAARFEMENSSFSLNTLLNNKRLVVKGPDGTYKYGKHAILCFH
jgi:hypothetical protein